MGMIDKEDAKKAICEVCYMYKYIGDEYKECRYYPCDDIKALEAIPSAEAEQVTSKLKKHCDSLLTDDSAECKEQKSKLDLISRAKVLNVVQNADDGNIPYEVIKDIIQGLPSVSAERVGKWIWCGDKGDSRFMCSVCKSKENVPTCMGEPSVWDYCPNCGAIMKGGDE